MLLTDRQKTIKGKVLTACVIATSLIGYLQWGKDNSMLLLQGELEILYKLFTTPTEVIHPMVLAPLAGQVLLAITLFQQRPSRWMVVTGMAALAILLLFILFIGVMGMRPLIALSAVPFVISAVMMSLHLRSTRQSK